MRAYWILGIWLVAGCASTKAIEAAHTNSHVKRYKRYKPYNLKGVPAYTPAYTLKNDCPNWKQALATARRKMGCDAGSAPPSDACQKKLPCDVCQFLREGTWPSSFIVDFTAGIRDTISVYGAVMWDPQWIAVCPTVDKTHAEFNKALCFGPGLWGFDKVDTLAKAQVHEAMHLCKAVGGAGPSTIDKNFKDYLLCPDPDAADVVEICWKPQG